MGKYFKEEVNSNRVKRFKTSDTQEKNLRFAQLSKVITALDRFKDFTKLIFQTWMRTSKLIKVDTKLLVKLEDEFNSIVEAKKLLAANYFKNKNNLLKEQKELEDKRLLLPIEKKTERDELSNIIATKQDEIKKLDAQFDKIESTAKENIQKVVDDFNRTKSPITSTLRWNLDLENPKMDWIIGMPLSPRGTQIALPRINSETPLGINQLLSSFSRSGRTNLDVKTKLDRLGWDDLDRGYDFLDVATNQVEKKSLYQIIEELSTNSFEAKLVLKNEDEQKRLIKDTEKFITIIEQSEKGNQNPLLKLLRPLVKKLGFATVVGGAIALPALVQQQVKSKDPKSVERSLQESATVLKAPPPNAAPQKTYEQEVLRINGLDKPPATKQLLLEALKIKYGK